MARSQASASLVFPALEGCPRFRGEPGALQTTPGIPPGGRSGHGSFRTPLALRGEKPTAELEPAVAQVIQMQLDPDNAVEGEGPPEVALAINPRVAFGDAIGLPEKGQAK